MRHLIPALRIFLLNVVASIYLQLDTVMLGFLKGNEAVGYYTGAIKLTKMLMGITSSLCVVLLPRLSNLVVENEHEEFEQLLRKALDYVITIAAPMSMGLVIMAPTLVYLFCGEGYVPSISTMQITAPIILFISISYVLVQSIFSLGKENITIITGIVGALTNVAINFMLIPHWAQDGAAIGTLLAEFSVMIAYLFIIRRFSINNRNVPELRLSREFTELLDEHTRNKQNQSKESKDALIFLKQKVDAAQGFINAVKQRQQTLLSTMQAIIDLQRPFFEEGDESLLRPMILKDVAERTKLDISTISRVSNSKYVQTNYGIYPLKFFFSDGYTTENGEELSVREIKRILKECVASENKEKPYTDDELADMLKEKGYPIARRTVAKYRQQLNIPVARLRR